MLSLEQIRARWTNFKIKTREKWNKKFGKKEKLIEFYVSYYFRNEGVANGFACCTLVLKKFDHLEMIKQLEKTIEGRKVNIVPLFVKEVGEINAQG